MDKFLCFDIESTPDMFEISITNENGNAYTFFIIDNTDVNDQVINKKQEIIDKAKEKNKKLKTLSLFNLKEEQNVIKLANIFGITDALSVKNKLLITSQKDYYYDAGEGIYKKDNKPHIYKCGYNSTNYDTCMLAYLLSCIIDKDGKINTSDISAAEMRIFNDKLFENKVNMPEVLNDYNEAKILRRFWLKTGLFLDVARLNEKQSKIALKKILGLLGYQILESDELNDTGITFEKFTNITAYNISDCLYLDKLRNHPTYKSVFDLKKSLLDEYFDDLVFNETKTEIKWGRITPESTSAVIVSNVLAPYKPLSDIKAVSFMYPEESIAKKTGIKQFNVLDTVYNKYMELLHDIEERTGKRPKNEFKKVYDFYKSIEGKNFNASDKQEADYGELEWNDSDKFRQTPLVVRFIKDNGKFSSTYANFSIGGIHGAEIYIDKFEKDKNEFNTFKKAYNIVRSAYQDDPVLFKKTSIKKAKETGIKNTEVNVRIRKKEHTFSISNFVTGTSYKNLKWKSLPEKPSIKDENGGIKDKYTYTSFATLSFHDDFSSYYPNLLIKLNAFYNPDLGEDRYYKTYVLKEEYGKKKKDPNISEEERKVFDIKRNGCKLILNSATGAADSNYNYNIRMNNRIISMRIIGQLFSFYIAQLIEFSGGKVPSLNTDGLYASDITSETNENILTMANKMIGIKIEPEPMALISKDVNTRVEFHMDTKKIEATAGASVSAYNGVNVEKALSHPFILDTLLVQYMTTFGIDKPCNTDKLQEIYKNIFDKLKTKKDYVNLLLAHSFMVGRSATSTRIAFGKKDDNSIIHMLKYNRVFCVKNDTPESFTIMYAKAKKITPAQIEKRRREGLSDTQIDPTAFEIFKKENIPEIEYAGKDIKSEAIGNNFYLEDKFLMCNNDYDELSLQEIKHYLSKIDYKKYTDLVKKTFDTNWYNEPV